MFRINYKSHKMNINKFDISRRNDLISGAVILVNLAGLTAITECKVLKNGLMWKRFLRSWFVRNFKKLKSSDKLKNTRSCLRPVLTSYSLHESHKDQTYASSGLKRISRLSYFNPRFISNFFVTCISIVIIRDVTLRN